jgi:hypothetical protein
MSKRTLLFACLLASGNVAAQMEISILRTQYQTDLRTEVVQFQPPPPPSSCCTIRSGETQTQRSNQPIIGAELAPTQRIFAKGTADTFFVSTSTSGLIDTTKEVDGTARAVARTDLTFSPLADGLAPLKFEIALTDTVTYSAGFMSLRDLTLDQDMAYYYWRGRIGPIADIPSGTNIPGFHFEASPRVDVSAGAQLFDSHDYALTVFTTTDANDDFQAVSIRTVGLIPEPETWAMMLAGLGVVGWIARRQRAAHAAFDERRALPT